ncbi:hypothetical protein SDC9_52628 [bioreactor metagenome]|uniref:Uncharacterized protein n=1 Tax=bioreactor metagenome TaxID=1076179 RepID=A0A644WRK3_9ZZZZ
MTEITNYEAMLESANIIKSIADTAVKTGTKAMSEANGDVVAKISQYIFETIRPIFDSPIGDFTVNNHPYDGTLYFRRNANWGPEYKGQLRNDNLGILVYFSKDGYRIDRSDPKSVAKFIGGWRYFKESLDKTIRESIQKYNKEREQEVDSLAYLSKVLEGFEV